MWVGEWVSEWVSERGVSPFTFTTFEEQLTYRPVSITTYIVLKYTIYQLLVHVKPNKFTK